MSGFGNDFKITPLSTFDIVYVKDMLFVAFPSVNWEINSVISVEIFIFFLYAHFL